MSFEKFEPKRRYDVPAIGISKGQITLNKLAYKIIEELKDTSSLRGNYYLVDIFIDTEALKVKFVKSIVGQKIYVYKNSILIRADLTKKLPEGRYFFDQNEMVFIKSRTEPKL